MCRAMRPPLAQAGRRNSVEGVGGGIWRVLQRANTIDEDYEIDIDK